MATLSRVVSTVWQLKCSGESSGGRDLCGKLQTTVELQGNSAKSVFGGQSANRLSHNTTGGGARPQNDIHQSNIGKCGTPNAARREGTDTVQKKEGIGCVRDFRTVHKCLE